MRAWPPGSYSVTLRSGGTITIRITPSEYNLSDERDRDDHRFVMSLVDELLRYEAAAPTDDTPAAAHNEEVER